MPYGINTETVNAHLDVLAVSVNYVLCNCGVLGVEVNAVACNLRELCCPIIVVRILEITGVVIVVGVIGLACRDFSHLVILCLGNTGCTVADIAGIGYVLHQVQSLLILSSGLLLPVILGRAQSVGFEQVICGNH